MGKASDQPTPPPIRLPRHWFVLAEATSAVNKQRDALNPMTQAITAMWKDHLSFEYARRAGLTGGGVVHEPMIFSRRLRGGR